MDRIKIEEAQFIYAKENNAEFIFSTAEGKMNFNKSTLEGKENIIRLKEYFSLNEIGILNQIHSDFIFVYDGDLHDGDALITNKQNIGIGVFTADCVPILVYDPVKEAIGAIHSGWKGTANCVVKKTIEKMREEYGSNYKDLIVYIGPHIMECCYEVGQEVIEEFNKVDLYKNLKILNGKRLNLQECIIGQLKYMGVGHHNIKTIDSCTFCENKHKLYSYRKNKNSDRMFSLIFIKK